jgi:hypothetical protein
VTAVAFTLGAMIFFAKIPYKGTLIFIFNQKIPQKGGERGDS